MSLKTLMRNDLKTRRAHLASAFGDYSGNILSLTIPSILEKIPENSQIAGYFPLPTEFDCLFLLKHLHTSHNFKISLPVVDSGRILKFKSWDLENNSLTKDKYGIPSPQNIPPFIDPDVIIVPMLGFNREMYRIGYGGGYYDATLKYYSKAISIGLAFSGQLCESLPIDPHDEKLNYIVTEQGLFLQ